MEDRVKDYFHQYRRGGKSFAAAIKEQLRIRGAAGGGLQQLPKLPKPKSEIDTYYDELVKFGVGSEFSSDVEAMLRQWRPTMTRRASEAPPSLATYSDAEMIMEMIGRGYAVMKTPQGGTPETLK